MLALYGIQQTDQQHRRVRLMLLILAGAIAGVGTARKNGAGTATRLIRCTCTSRSNRVLQRKPRRPTWSNHDNGMGHMGGPAVAS